MSFGVNNQVLCYSCEQPITSRKEFAMGLLGLGSKLTPFHVKCWPEFFAHAPFWQRFYMNPTPKLAGRIEKAKRKTAKNMILGYAVLTAIITLIAIIFEGPRALAMVPMLAIMFAVIGGGIFVWGSRLSEKQNQQWDTCIALIPEE